MPFWQVVDANPEEHPHTLSLRMEREIGVTLNGAQVKTLIAQGRPVSTLTADQQHRPSSTTAGHVVKDSDGNEVFIPPGQEPL